MADDNKDIYWVPKREPVEPQYLTTVSQSNVDIILEGLRVDNPGKEYFVMEDLVLEDTEVGEHEEWDILSVGPKGQMKFYKTTIKRAEDE